MKKRFVILAIIAVVVVLFGKGVFAHEPEATEGFTTHNTVINAEKI